MTLTPCTDRRQRAALKRLYRAAFPPAERKPFSMILRTCRRGDGEMLAMVGEDGSFLGLAITLLHGGLVLLDYLAVTPEARGQGIGTATLAALRARYADRRLLLEIEDPDEPSDNRADRLRRQAFYRRCGMVEMPYRVWLFGVKMRLLTDGEPVSYEEYHEIFEALFPPFVGRHITKASD